MRLDVTQIKTPPEAQRPGYLEELINEDQAAKALGVTKRALRNWRVRGGGPKYVKVSSRCIRYRRRDLLDWTEARIRENTSDLGISQQVKRFLPRGS